MKIKHLINKDKYIIEDNKSGFTLIETIVVIGLISLIAVSGFLGVRTFSKNVEAKKYQKFYEQFDDALSVYLSENPEIYKNLSDNVEGAIISLELLKNEGLIRENIKDPKTNEIIDYTNNYYVLSDAVLLNEEVSEEEAESMCNGRLGIEVIKNWDVLSGNVNMNDVVYVCPKETVEREEEELDVDDLLERIESLENALSLVNLGGDSWVLFDVQTDTSKSAYWPEENQDLWSIVEANGDEMKIIYNNYVNNKSSSSPIQYKDPTNKCTNFYNTKNRSWSVDTSKVKYLDLSKNSVYRSNYNESLIMEYNGAYYVLYQYNSGNWRNPSYTCKALRTITNINYLNTKYGALTNVNNLNGWSRKEIETDKYNTAGSKKKDLFDKVVHNSYIKEKDYYYDYDTVNNNAIEELNTTVTLKDKFGTLSTDDPIKNIRSLLLGKNFYIGSYTVNIRFDTYNGFVSFSNGTLTTVAVNDFDDSNSSDYFEYYNDYDDVLVGGTYGTYINTMNYIPVFTISFDSLLQNIDSYPSAYKTKYSKCTSDDLGSKECPYVMKLSDSTFSWNG